MKPLPIKRQFTLLACLLKHWHRCTHLPRWQRLLWRVPALFTHEPIRETIYALIATDGEWKLAQKNLASKPFAPRLFKWVQQQKRGL